MAQNTDQLRPQEQESGSRPESGVSRDTERIVPVRTEQERLIELEAQQIERKILEGEKLRPEQSLESPPVSPAPAPVKQNIDPVTKAVEDILSEDLGPMYSQMTPEQQAVFRKEGERTASVIRTMLDEVKLKTTTLLDLIIKWLRLIPGVNKFFLEQEAKIKADKVVAIHDQLHKPQP